MALMIPNTLSKDVPEGEQKIFYRLQKSIGTEGWIVMHSLNLKRHERKASTEIDFLIVVPNLGIVALEVKGSDVRRIDGKWDYGYTIKAESPFKQAETAVNALKKELMLKNSELGRLLFTSAVAFTYIDFNEESAEWHKWQIINRSMLDRSDISNIIRKILKHAHEHIARSPNSNAWYAETSSRPSKEQVETLKRLLRPDFEYLVSPRVKVQAVNDQLLKLTDEQIQNLDALADNRQVVIKGLAGTGKTVLALEQARRCASQGKRTLILCYNKLLARHLDQYLKITSGINNPNIRCSTIHALAREISRVKVTGEEGQEFWQSKLPNMAVERLLTDESPIDSYDVLIVDEAQDVVTESYMEFLDCLVKGGLASGNWMMFGDFDKQAIYLSGDGSNAEKFYEILKERDCRPASFTLRVNCRNSVTVSETVSLVCKLDPGYAKCLKVSEISQVVPAFYKNESDHQSLLNVQLQQLQKLFDPEDIVILSAKKLTYAPSLRLGNTECLPYESTNAGTGKIRFSTISAFKGLEAKAVIIAGIERLDAQDIALLYVGMSRASVQLVLLMNEGLKSTYKSML